MGKKKNFAKRLLDVEGGSKMRREPSNLRRGRITADLGREGGLNFVLLPKSESLKLRFRPIWRGFCMRVAHPFPVVGD